MTEKTVDTQRHETDLSKAASDAQERAASEAEESRKVSVEEAAKRRSTLDEDPGRDGVIEGVLLDAARKAEDAKRADDAEVAGEMGNGFRVPPTSLEAVPPTEKYDNPRGRKFDVGGQPVFDPENEERLRQAADKKSSRRARPTAAEKASAAGKAEAERWADQAEAPEATPEKADAEQG